MKVFCFIIILFTQCTNNLYSAKLPVKDTLSNNSLTLFYVIDKVWYPTSIGPYRRDYTPSYIQVVNGKFIVTGRFIRIGRPIVLYMYGYVDGVKERKSAKGEYMISFFVRGRERSAGYVRSVEMTFKKDNKIEIYFFDKLGLGEIYLSGHRATLNEIIEIKKYWKSQDPYEFIRQ